VEERNVWIEMSDGVRLNASLFMPDSAGPHATILEGLPYRKDDITQYHKPEYRRLCNEGGFVVARVDLRGTGSSEGIATDEYPTTEQRDLCEVIDWLAGQPWSNGAVGMYGASYGGFNSIQVAMEQPRALKAIVPIYATDDRYTDDVHYYGGARRGWDFIDYPTYMVAMNALPPVPAIAGSDWRQRWKDRLETLEPWLLRWIEEQFDGPYWRHGSLRPNYDLIRCPTMIVAGWADGYRNATLRMLSELRVPARLLIGPWSHTSTETSLPGPHIDLVPELIRWFARWLRDEPNGIEEEPPIVMFSRRSTRPAPDLEEMRGEWRFEEMWPPDRLSVQVLRVSEADAVGRGVAVSDELVVRGDVGYTASMSCAGGLPFGQPWDQRRDEAFSIVYDWGALDEELEILGYPEVELLVTSSAPVAFVSVKLCDVFPDGTSALVSRGLLNLTHRESSTRPEPLEPGRIYQVRLEMDATSWVFEPGHRVRLGVAGTDWPNVWTPPGPVTLEVTRASSALSLPLLRGAPAVKAKPQLTPPTTRREPTDPTTVWRFEHDVLARRSRHVIDHGSTYDLGAGGTATERYSGVNTVSIYDPGDASAEGNVSFELKWDEATVGAVARTRVTSDSSSYRLRIELDVTDDGKSAWSRTWERTVPRRLQ
jgi:uncharacterized protein